MVLSSRRRREEIVRLAETRGLTEVSGMADRFQVSASTIRRDLAQLEASGRLARTYGGAMAAQSHAEPSLQQRIGEAFADKLAIATWAAEQIQPGESVALDAGSTVAALAHRLRERTGVTVTTASLTVIGELTGAQGVTLHCLGGTLRPLSQAMVGPITEIALTRMSFDRVFLGADSVDAERGICEADLHQTQLKELMAQRSEHVYVLAHAAKLGRRPFHAWTRLSPGWTLVTTGRGDLVEPFLERGVRVISVPVP
ncbi:DeoR/GlpR family DNA-binding transcription regulator [Kineosporia succinea]|uniref:DeoR/GlpR family transcriptional regulator of sugar metabolism n=1 Tax=Kineosporia succinea TaxID=84632 RepID=A0ABT9P968_9ACTN|nr:DeoR/GlpR family DNA-binding transcription regulator [Kineosporia succinea]MDP9828959.1 DeoR/GlpR family transcriptional regulator of sugar metabolism [Kineosporia succinea]